MAKTTSNRIDLYSEVTSSIVAELEKGPEHWSRSWTSAVDLWRPNNHSTERPYRGVNVLLLAFACSRQGFGLNRWVTFRQALELDAHVRKGARGVRVVFWKQVASKHDAQTEQMDAPPESESRAPVVARHFYVFNVADVEGIAEAQHVPPTTASLAARLVKESGATIVQGEPCYKPAQDIVMLPPLEAFQSAQDYYATAFHELCHWTAPRIGREVQAKRWGDDAYAMEELVAEMAAAMLCSACGIPSLMQSASYLNHWLRVLRSDSRAIFSAASAAQKAADYLLARVGDQRLDP